MHFFLLSTLLDGNITALFVDNFEVHGVDRSRPTLIFHGYFTTSSNITRQQIIDLIDISPDLTLYYLAPLDYFPQRYPLVDSELVKNFTCQNGGILLPNSTCVCPGFISGRQCEIIKCGNL
uniref:EGF-like domain-containing protein n=1 Tax=Heterorhabditis bacteriophora TaxID=37862 RepID=A0A1I7XL66_HETBA